MGELLEIYLSDENIHLDCDKNWVSLDKAREHKRANVNFGEGPGHCYIECVYDDLFKKYKERQGHLLEIGI